MDPLASYSVLIFCSSIPTGIGLSCSDPSAGTLDFVLVLDARADVLELKGWGITITDPLNHPCFPSICSLSVLMCVTDASTDRIVPLFAAASGKNHIYITKCSFPAKTESEVRRQPLKRKKETLKQITHIH